MALNGCSNLRLRNMLRCNSTGKLRHYIAKYGWVAGDDVPKRSQSLAAHEHRGRVQRHQDDGEDGLKRVLEALNGPNLFGKAVDACDFLLSATQLSAGVLPGRPRGADPTSKTSFDAPFQTARMADFIFCAMELTVASSDFEPPSSVIFRRIVSQRGSRMAIS